VIPMKIDANVLILDSPMIAINAKAMSAYGQLHWEVPNAHDMVYQWVVLEEYMPSR